MRRRVMQASTLTRFSGPPNAAMTCSALLSVAVGADAVFVAVAVPPAVTVLAEPEPSARFACSSASNSVSGSRPGVLRFHFVIANRNNR